MHNLDGSWIERERLRGKCNEWEGVSVLSGRSGESDDQKVGGNADEWEDGVCVCDVFTGEGECEG